MMPRRAGSKSNCTVSGGLSDRGSSVVSFVILAPVLLFLVLGVAQVAIIGHVRHVATLAATAGAGEAAAFDGTASVGESRAQAQLYAASGWVLNPSVAVTRSDTEVTATVTAEAYKILPFGSFSVAVERVAPVERPQE